MSMIVSRPSNHSASPLRVLVIDDDADVNAHFCRSIARLGGECLSVQGLTEILIAIERWKPSHIILDLFMPGENGMNVARGLAEAQVKIPTILTSGGEKRLMEAVARSARGHGLNISALLAKPFTRARLAACLGQDASTDVVPAKHSATRLPSADFSPEELAEAIAKGMIKPFVQPKVSCVDRSLVGFEVLARWQHPDLGILGPDRFIGLAEKSGQIGALTMAMVEPALDWLCTTRFDRASIAFNIAPSLLDDTRFVADLQKSIANRHVAPSRVAFEVTESTKLSDDIATFDRLTDLRLSGIGLSIDDFGVGYSSLLQLAHLPFSEIKIDKSFVTDTNTSEEALAIIASVVSLAKRLGMTTVAEGIEDEATFQRLRAVGCDQVQGYHFARPMSLEAAQGCPIHFAKGAGTGTLNNPAHVLALPQ